MNNARILGLYRTLTSFNVRTDVWEWLPIKTHKWADRSDTSIVRIFEAESRNYTM